MANGYHEVKKHQPCLICGTADWCCRVPAEDGYGDVHICKRYTDPRVNAANPEGDVIGHDRITVLTLNQTDYVTALCTTLI